MALFAGISVRADYIHRLPCGGTSHATFDVPFLPAAVVEPGTDHVGPGDGVDPTANATTDPCYAACVSPADQTYVACITDGGDPTQCADTGQGLLLNCLRTHCDDALPTDACGVSCHWQSEKVYGRCGSATVPPSATCVEQSQLVWHSCLEEHCGVTPPLPTCDQRCQQAGRDAFDDCRGAGFRPEACSYRAKEATDQCLQEKCQLPPPRPACEVRCDEAADEAYAQCTIVGNPPAACTRTANETRQRCMENECGVSPVCAAGCSRQRVFDSRGDAVRRAMIREQLPNDAPPEPAIDLLDVILGAWMPVMPSVDLFEGQYRPDGLFVRLDLRLAGLVNPPGSIDPAAFLPNYYGRRPLYAYIELDVDRNVNTGGEIDFPQFRFLMNAGRFGGFPSRPTFRDRVALDSAAVDDAFSTPPYVERHGEEFHLALLGGQELSILERRGDGDRRFERDEVWLLRGSFLHRAHGYEMFSFAEGGRLPGEYAPIGDLLFRHDPQDDVTIVSIVFPLNNQAAGLVRNRPPEPPNGNPSDQASILEALDDLHFSASFLEAFPTELAEEAIVADWAEQLPGNYLNAGVWSLTALVGMAPQAPDRNHLAFVWTDIWPDVVTGDVDGNGIRTDGDEALIDQRIRFRDPADGNVDGRAIVPDFPRQFSLFDVNYDGVLSSVDFVAAEGDADDDGDVDLADVAAFQSCFGSAGAFPPCLGVNLFVDPAVDGGDLPAFTWLLTGPVGD